MNGETTPDEAVTRHLPLVGMALRRFPHSPEEREELYQQGCVGLMEAARRYDASRGAFSTYAVPCILGEMRAWRRKASGMPRTDYRLMCAIRAMQEKLTAEMHREPTVQELADALHITAEDVIAHAPGHQADADAALLPSPEDMERRIELRDILQRLPKQDQQLILLRHRLGLTQAETGARLGMTQMQVSRREAIIRTLLHRAVGE